MSLKYKALNKITLKIIDNKNMWDMIYPVGSIYLTFSNTVDPNNFVDSSIRTNIQASILNWWTWTLVEENFYLRTASISTPSLKGGVEGGQNSFNLKVKNLPPHYHEMDKHRHTRGDMNITGNFGWMNVWKGQIYDGAFYQIEKKSNGGYKGNGTDEYVNWGFDASKTWSGSTSWDGPTETKKTGEGIPVNIEPRYKAVYVWERTV